MTEPNFAKNMKSYREKRGYSIIRLSEESGVSKSTIGNWETGKRHPNFLALLCVCRVFNCTIDEYVMGYEKTI